MKTRIIFLLIGLLVLMINQQSFAQTEFWFEDFGTGCNQGQLANGFASSNGTWGVVNTGTNSASANTFYVSATEQIGVSGCGTGCSGDNNRTLHVSNVSLLFGLIPADGGALYNAGGFFLTPATTNRRVESPVIDCSSYTDVSISFDYIEFGDGTLDNATLWFFNGTAWSQLADMPKTVCCGGPCDNVNQGSFTSFSIALPASADNNPDVRIGFQWVNNDDGVGTDPSFAVDNISISGLEACETAFGTDAIVACETHTWIDGNTYTESNYSAQFNFVEGAANGCDSVVTLNLTITGNNLAFSTSSTPATLGFANGSATVSVSGGQAPYTYQWNDPFMQTNATAVGLFPGTYSCSVSDDAQCNVQISVFVDFFTGVPETQVHNNHCNTGGFNLGSLVSAVTVQNADAYRWEFTEQGGGTLPEYTRYQANPHILLHWVSGIELAKIYEVRVKARLDGNWGNYGNICTITTVSDVPHTEVRPQYTPTNLQGNPYAMCNLATAYTVNGAENYEWEFDNGVDPVVLYQRGVGNPHVKLSWVDCLKPDHTYQTRVRAQVGGQWGTFGNAHPLEMAPTANTALRSTICGTTRSLNKLLLPNPVCIADSYEYELVNTMTSDVHTAISTNAAGSVILNSFTPPLVPGAEYSVRVKATQCGEEGDFSSACNITIAGPQAEGDEIPALRTMAENSATLYPNPNAGTEVRVELDGLGDGNHEVMIQIYDIYGKLIQTEGFGHTGSAMSRMVRFDGHMVMGMYIVQIVVDGERFTTERLVIK